MIDKEKVRAKEYMKAGEKTLVVLSIQPRLSVLIFFFFLGGGEEEGCLCVFCGVVATCRSNRVLTCLLGLLFACPSKALLILKKKKYQEKLLESTLGQLDHLERMVHGDQLNRG